MLDKKSEERLIAYLLDDLSDEERTAVEAEFRNDPQLAEELTRLEECLQAQEPEPEVAPAQLTKRTCWLVERAIAQARSFRGEPKVALGESNDPVLPRSRWSFLDMVAGAAILVALAGLLMPALREGRDSTRRLSCQNNLGQLGRALVEYNERYRQGLPSLEADENAGMYIVFLVEHGIVTPEDGPRLVVCPSTDLADKVFSGCVQISAPSREELKSAPMAIAEYLRRTMGGNYAFCMGFIDSQGRLRQTPFTGDRFTAMLADAPCGSVPFYQSGNHGMCGQNIAFQDGSVRFVRLCQELIERDHPFLNDDGRHQAGLLQADIVMGRSEARPGIGLSVALGLGE